VLDDVTVAANVSGVVITSSPGPISVRQQRGVEASRARVDRDAAGAETAAANSASNWATLGRW